jgi:hypothetical protein
MLVARRQLRPAALATAIALAGTMLATTEEQSERRSGPPIEQVVRKGAVGPFEFEDFRETYVRSRNLGRRRHPFDGSWYWGQPFRSEVMQGQAVFRHRHRALWLLHNFFCSKPAGTAELPWACEARVLVVRGGRRVAERTPGEHPRRTEDEGFLLLDPETESEIKGDFEMIEPHPELPLFAGLVLGCCDSPSRVSVHDFEGRVLCPTADLYFGLEESPRPWTKMPVDNQRLRCPDGRWVTIPTPSGP